MVRRDHDYVMCVFSERTLYNVTTLDNVDFCYTRSVSPVSLIQFDKKKEIDGIGKEDKQNL